MSAVARYFALCYWKLSAFVSLIEILEVIICYVLTIRKVRFGNCIHKEGCWWIQLKVCYALRYLK
jgi:hypothetical protein